MIESVKPKNHGYFMSDQLTEKSAERITDCYEIELYTTSNGSSFVCGKQIPHHKGNILIVKPHQMRQSIGLFECHYLHFYCFDKKFSETYLDVLPQLINNDDTIHLCELFQSITEAATNKQKGIELFITAKIFELTALLFTMTENYKAADIKFRQYQFNIYEASKFIQNNFSEHITLSDIARTANLSPSYFHVVFKNIMSTTPQKYLLNIRIKTAQKLLLNSKKSLAEIAEECGFQSQVYMNYVFKKELNTTPKHFRDREKVTIL